MPKLKKGLMKPCGVIFDFDGVVVDSLGMHLEAWSEATQQLFRQKLQSPRRFQGYSTSAIAHMIAQELGHPSQAQSLAMLKRQLLADGSLAPAAFPGAKELMQVLLDRHLPFGIASNAPRQFILMAIAKLELPVTTVVALDDVKRGKPYPDPFNLCAERLGLSGRRKAESLVLEDSFHGLQAAIASGMIPIGVASHHTPDELKKAGARLVCQSPAEILQHGWLDALPLGEML